MEPTAKRRKTLGIRFSLKPPVLRRVEHVTELKQTSQPDIEEFSEPKDNQSLQIRRQLPKFPLRRRKRGPYKRKAKTGYNKLPLIKASDKVMNVAPVLHFGSFPKAEPEPLGETKLISTTIFEPVPEPEEEGNVWNEESVQQVLMGNNSEPHLFEEEKSKNTPVFDKGALEDIFNSYDEPSIDKNIWKNTPNSTALECESPDMFADALESLAPDQQIQREVMCGDNHEAVDEETQFRLPTPPQLSTDFVPNERRKEKPKAQNQTKSKVDVQPNNQNKKFFQKLKTEIQEKLRTIHPSMHYPTMEKYEEKNNELAKLYKTSWIKRSCAICAHVGKPIEKFANDPFHQFGTERSFRNHWKNKHSRVFECEVCQHKCNDAKSLKGHLDRMKKNPNILHFQHVNEEEYGGNE